MAASQTGLQRVFAFDNNTSTLAAVGGAQNAFPTLNTGANQNGVDGSVECEAPANTSTSLVAGEHYSLWSGDLGVSYDMSGPKAAMSMHFRNFSPSYTAIETNSDSIWMILFSGTGTTNYGRWHFGGSAFTNGNWHVITCQGTPDATGGTFDASDVTGVGIAVESRGAGFGFGFQIGLDQCVMHEGVVQLNDTGGAATVDLLDCYDLFKPDSGETYHSDLVAIAGTTIEFAFPVAIESDDYDDTATPFSFAFKSANGIGYPDMPSGFFSLDYTSQSGGNMNFGAKSIATLGTAPDWAIDASTSSITIFPHLAADVNDVVLIGANLVCNGTTTILDANSLEIADADLDLVVTDCLSAINWTADLVAGSTISTNSDLHINFAETDLSDINLNFTASNTVTVSPTTGSGTYDLSGVTTTGTITLDNDTANNTTIVLPAGTSNTVASPTTGGGAIVVDADVTVDVQVTVRDQATKSLISDAVVYLEADTGGSMAQGTVILNETTTATGVASTSLVVSGDQPVLGRVRKSSASPFYTNFPLSGTITSSGFATTALMIRED